jgi:hypothetical protein
LPSNLLTTDRPLPGKFHLISLPPKLLVSIKLLTVLCLLSLFCSFQHDEDSEDLEVSKKKQRLFILFVYTLCQYPVHSYSPLHAQHSIMLHCAITAYAHPQ